MSRTAHSRHRSAIAAVRDRKTRFVPDNWSKTFFNWMENIQPWCVSRQLWWGHRIPAWYGPVYNGAHETYDFPGTTNAKVFVAETVDELIPQLDEYYGRKCEPVHFEDFDDWRKLGLRMIGSGSFRDEHRHQIPLFRDPD